MNKLKTTILSLAMLLTLSATMSFAQTVEKPTSKSTAAVSKPALTRDQLANALARTQDALIFANSKLSACQEAVDAYKQSDSNNEDVKAKLAAERDTYKNLVDLLTNQATEYKTALEAQRTATQAADKRAVAAETEVVRQKKKVSFWRKTAGYTFVIGAAAGAAGVLILENR